MASHQSTHGLVDEDVPEIDETDQHIDPGQPYAKVLFSNDDPMKSNKIVFAGDQLTRVRFSGAKDLLQGYINIFSVGFH